MVITEKQALIMYDIVKSVLYMSSTEQVAGYSKEDIGNLLNSIIKQCDDIENIVVKNISNIEEPKVKQKESIIEESIKEIDEIVNKTTTKNVTVNNPIGDEFDFGDTVPQTFNFGDAISAMTTVKPNETVEIVDVNEKYKQPENVEVVILKQTEQINTSLFDEEPEVTDAPKVEQETKVATEPKTVSKPVETKIEEETEVKPVVFLSSSDIDWDN